MAVPNANKRRSMNDRSRSKRFKSNGKHSNFGPSGRYGPPGMMRDAFGPGLVPSMRSGPGPRFPPGPMFRGGMGPPPMGFMPPGPPGFHPRLRGPPPRPGPGMPPIPPPFMRPPFPGAPFPRPLLPNPGMRSNQFGGRIQNKTNRNNSRKVGNSKLTDDIYDMTKPWATEDLRTENAKRLQLLKTARQTKNEKDWEAYKTHKQKVCTLVKEAKEKYLSKNPQEVRSDAFQINPNATSKGVDFTEDLKF